MENGSDLPGIGWPPQSSQACRGGNGSGGAVVKRDALFLESVGSCTRETESPFAPTPRRASMANEMGAMLACTAAKAVASSLFDLLHSFGADGKAPSTHDVVGDHRYAGLGP